MEKEFPSRMPLVGLAFQATSALALLLSPASASRSSVLEPYSQAKTAIASLLHRVSQGSIHPAVVDLDRGAADFLVECFFTEC